jgi:hypothetical protein
MNSPRSAKRPVKNKLPTYRRRKPTVVAAPKPKQPLLTLVLHEGGMVTVDKKPLVNHLMRGIEYKALAAMTSGLHEFLGQLIELCHTSRLMDVLEQPVMKEPGELQ